MPSIERYGNKLYLHTYHPEKKYYMGAISTISGRTFFVTHLKEIQRHYYQKIGGYALNQQLINQLEKSMINEILIPVLDEYTVYKARVTQYKNSETLHEPNTEPQYILPAEELEQIPMDAKTFRNLMRHIHGDRYEQKLKNLSEQTQITDTERF